jgi:hypothetical protein
LKKLSPVRGDSTFVHLVPREGVNRAEPALCGSVAPDATHGRRWRRVGVPSDKSCNSCLATASADREAEIEWSTK